MKFCCCCSHFPLFFLDFFSLFLSVIRRGPRDRSYCFWNIQMWKLVCSKAIDCPLPHPIHHVLIVLIVLFISLPNVFNFNILTGEESISCWSLCFAIVWSYIGEQCDSPVCYLSLGGGLPEGRKYICGDHNTLWTRFCSYYLSL